MMGRGCKSDTMGSLERVNYGIIFLIQGDIKNELVFRRDNRARNWLFHLW